VTRRSDQDTERERDGQTQGNGAKKLEWERVKVTGTPMLGLPPVPSGDYALFWYEVYSGVVPVMGVVVPMNESNSRRIGAGPRRVARRQHKGRGLTAYR
jgi:hypothetical protein